MTPITRKGHKFFNRNFLIIYRWIYHSSSSTKSSYEIKKLKNPSDFNIIICEIPVMTE